MKPHIEVPFMPRKSRKKAWFQFIALQSREISSLRLGFESFVSFYPSICPTFERVSSFVFPSCCNCVVIVQRKDKYAQYVATFQVCECASGDFTTASWEEDNLFPTSFRFFSCLRAPPARSYMFFHGQAVAKKPVKKQTDRRRTPYISKWIFSNVIRKHSDRIISPLETQIKELSPPKHV